MLRVKCWCCGKSVRGGDEWAGRTTKCPSCNSEIVFAKHPTNDAPSIQAPLAPTAANVELTPIEPPQVSAATFEPAKRERHVGPNPILSRWPYALTAVALIVGYLIGRGQSETVYSPPTVVQANGQVVVYTPDPHRQKERKEFIDRMLRDRWFEKIEQNGAITNLWIKPVFHSVSRRQTQVC